MRRGAENHFEKWSRSGGGLHAQEFESGLRGIDEGGSKEARNKNLAKTSCPKGVQDAWGSGQSLRKRGTDSRFNKSITWVTLAFRMSTGMLNLRS